MEDIAAAKPANGSQVLFQQVYLSDDDTETKKLFRQAEKLGFKGIVFTIDSAADGNRHRAARYSVGSADSSYTYITWDFYKKIQKMTPLPVILKGIQSVEDVKLAAAHGAPAVILSNHGGRQLDSAPFPVEIAIEIHQEAPELFQQIEIYADGGVRYGLDVLGCGLLVSADLSCLPTRTVSRASSM